MPDAGWFPDPGDGGRLRWWDGRRWSDEGRPPDGARSGREEAERAPGWYDDPQRAAAQRFWDGTRWTDRTYGAVSPPASAPVAPSPDPQHGSSPSAPGPEGRGVPAVLVVVLAVVVGLVAAGVTFLFVRDGGDDVATVEGEDVSSTTPADRAPGSGADGSSTSTLTPTPQRVEPATPSNSTPSASVRPGDAEGAGGWIAVLASTPLAEGRAAADARLAEVRSVVPEAQLVLSDDYASLNAGYWVTYVSGFADESSVVAFCETRGLAVPSQCYGRVLSRNPDDRVQGGG